MRSTASLLPPPPPPPAHSRLHLAVVQLTYKEGPLSGQAIIRGAYVNTASKDVGIDPDFQKVAAAWLAGCTHCGSSSSSCEGAAGWTEACCSLPPCCLLQYKSDPIVGNAPIGREH